MKLNPLAISCALGIIAGYAAPHFVEGLTQQRSLIIGLVAGLVIGLIADKLLNKSK